MRRTLLAGTALALAAAMAPAVALANMAAPWSPGDPVGEPAGELRQMDVLHETLDLDLRPLGDVQPAHVSATYRIHNGGAGADVDLFFVAPGLAGGSSGTGSGAVTLDGKPVASQPAGVQRGLDGGQPLPAEWQAPGTTPSLSGAGQLEYKVRNGTAAGLAFHAAIPAGDHDLAVRYDLEPSEYHTAEAYRAYQVGYVLAPARRWGSFKTLDVQVEVPTGWDVATSLPLTRSGDALRASFDGLPADALGVTARHPLPASPLYDAETVLPAAALVLATLVVAVVGSVAGGFAGRRGWRWPALVGLAAALALGGALLVFVSPLLGYTLWLKSLVLEERQLSRSWNYRGGLAPLALGTLGLLIGAALAPLTLLVNARRVRRRRRPATL